MKNCENPHDKMKITIRTQITIDKNRKPIKGTNVIKPENSFKTESLNFFLKVNSR